MKKSLMVSGMNFGIEFLNSLHKEVVKLGGTEEAMFESLKTGSPLIPKFAEMIVGTKKAALKYLKFIAKIAVKTNVVAKSWLFGEKASVKTYLGSNFQSWVFPELPAEIPAFEGEVQKTQLTKSMSDSEIHSELGEPKDYTVAQFIAIICYLLQKQAKGEDGVLLTNGYANIFRVKLANGCVVAVGRRWDSGRREWSFGAYVLDDDAWDGGSAVFSWS